MLWLMQLRVMLDCCAEEVDNAAEGQRDEPAFRVTEAMPTLLTSWSAIVKCGGRMEEKGQGSRLPTDRSKL